MRYHNSENLNFYDISQIYGLPMESEISDIFEEHATH